MSQNYSEKTSLRSCHKKIKIYSAKLTRLNNKTCKVKVDLVWIF
jgi:hypothetical protein